MLRMILMYETPFNYSIGILKSRGDISYMAVTIPIIILITPTPTVIISYTNKVFNSWGLDPLYNLSI